MNDKILFLDIDGVVNNATTFQRIKGMYILEPNAIFLVRKIIEETGAKVVLSSVWRQGEAGRNIVHEQVCDIIDITPTMRGEVRGEEIDAWLKKHPFKG